jgi:L-alanine-DL-glutamate epimerase-like enolase superfamily enzyme
MILDSIRTFALRIPFVTAFKHASAERAATQTLWVEARARDGTVGFGEGCPREFVTGETLETAQSFVVAHRPDWLATICDLGTLADWTVRHGRDIDANPAAWTAVELALLDLLGKEAARPVESLLGLPALAGCFRYTAVLGDASPGQFEAQLTQYLQAGFRDFKIKLSGNRMRDRAKASSLASAGISPRAVRADANNLWSDPEAAIDHVAALGYPFCALEEPLRPGDWEGMQRVGSALRTRIVLDESLARVSQLDRLGDAADRWIVNLRVSKMGGLLRSLELAAEARRRGLQVVIGAHVGETSLLTRAALTVAHSARDILLAQEGAFGTHLLSCDVVDPPIMFGDGGVLDTASLPRSGCGGFQVEVQNTCYQHYAKPLPEEQSCET